MSTERTNSLTAMFLAGTITASAWAAQVSPAAAHEPSYASRATADEDDDDSLDEDTFSCTQCDEDVHVDDIGGCHRCESLTCNGCLISLGDHQYCGDCAHDLRG